MGLLTAAAAALPETEALQSSCRQAIVQSHYYDFRMHI
jgi:hypothetical protein